MIEYIQVYPETDDPGTKKFESLCPVCKTKAVEIERRDNYRKMRCQEAHITEWNWPESS